MRINGFVPSESIFNTNFNVGQVENKNENIKSFSNYLTEKLDEVNDKQILANEVTNKFIAGEDISIHEVMLATEEAKMSLQLAVQVRNKLLEAYQELNRMQL